MAAAQTAAGRKAAGRNAVTQRGRRVSSGPRAVVVGAGFAGLVTVRTLARAGLRVTIVDRDVYSTFQPLLYQVATGGLNASDVSYPLRGFARRYGARFRHGELAAVDDQARRVTFADGSQLDYDYLILATGVSAAYYGVAGAQQHTCGLYTRRDAIALRDQLMGGLEALSALAGGADVSVTVVGRRRHRGGTSRDAGRAARHRAARHLPRD